MKKLKSYFKLLRPHHYVKNLLIFSPLFFAQHIADLDKFSKAFLASIAFSLVAGAIYVINDYKDVEQDKLHPKKKNRPLASGAVSKNEAIVLLMLSGFSGFGLMFLLGTNALLAVLAYFIMNLAYSFGLKHIAVIDIFIVSLGFVFRIVVGAFAADVPLTHWIIIMIFLLALFMSLGKRRDDVLLFNKTGEKMRKAVDGYNEQFLNIAMAISTSVLLVTYILYTTSEEVIDRFGTSSLYITAFFVLLGVFKYLQIIYIENRSGSPVEIVLKDRAIQLTVILWLLTFGALIYL